MKFVFASTALAALSAQRVAFAEDASATAARLAALSEATGLRGVGEPSAGADVAVGSDVGEGVQGGCGSPAGSWYHHIDYVAECDDEFDCKGHCPGSVLTPTLDFYHCWGTCTGFWARPPCTPDCPSGETCRGPPPPPPAPWTCASWAGRSGTSCEGSEYVYLGSYLYPSTCTAACQGLRAGCCERQYMGTDATNSYMCWAITESLTRTHRSWRLRGVDCGEGVGAARTELGAGQSDDEGQEPPDEGPVYHDERIEPRHPDLDMISSRPSASPAPELTSDFDDVLAHLKSELAKTQGDAAARHKLEAKIAAVRRAMAEAKQETEQETEAKPGVEDLEAAIAASEATTVGLHAQLAAARAAEQQEDKEIISLALSNGP